MLSFFDSILVNLSLISMFTLSSSYSSIFSTLSPVFFLRFIGSSLGYCFFLRDIGNSFEISVMILVTEDYSSLDCL